LLRKSNVLVLLALLLLVSSAFALSGKLGSARAVIHAEVTPDKPALMSRTLDVINSNDVPVNIKLEVSQNCTGIIKIDPKLGNFSLAAGETRTIPYTVKVTQPGTQECKINVYFKNADNKGAGVALSAVLVIVATGEGPDVPTNPVNETETNLTEDIPGDNPVTGGVSVNPGGEPKVNTPKADTNYYMIGTFVLMLIVVVILAIYAMKHRGKSVSSEPVKAEPVNVEPVKQVKVRRKSKNEKKP
jgi:hypothetical protein